MKSLFDVSCLWNSTRIRIALLLFLMSTAMGYASEEASKDVIWKRELAIDVQHMSLDLRFDWIKRRVVGCCALHLSMLKESDAISLDAGKLLVRSVKDNNSGELRFDYDGGDTLGNLVIHLERIYQPGQNLVLNIDYESTWQNHSDPNSLWGSIGKGLRFHLPTSTTPIKRKQIWSAGEPQGNRYWYPCYEVPNDLRTTTIRLTVEPEFVATATGDLVRETKNSDGTKTYQFDAKTPHPNYLTSIAVGDYIDTVQQKDGIELHTLGYPDEREGTIASVVRLPEMLEYFAKTTGTKYPFQRFTQVVVQDYPFPGRVGQHACVTVSDNMIDDFRTHQDFYYLWDGIEAQGLAAQWFGNLIVPKDWSHIWLSESFSRYMDAMFNIERNGLAEYLTFHADFDHGTVHADWNAGYRHPIVTENFSDVEEFVSDNYAKYRGALVLRLLHRELGDAKWLQVLSNYTQKHAHTLVSTKDLESIVDAVAGKSMAWFFDQWIYRMGHPVFEVSKAFDPKKKELTIVVNQVQKRDTESIYPQVDFFRGHIEIEIDGKRERVWLEPQKEQSFSFSLPTKPKFVHFDCESTWIKELRFEKGLDEWLEQSQNSSDPLGQRTAIVKLSEFGKQEATSHADKNRIVAAIRSVISSNKYWRVRVRAMSELQSLLTHSHPSGRLVLDEQTKDLLISVAEKETSWLRATSLSVLGATRDSKIDSLYLSALGDSSDRVINAAAIALGKSRSERAFDALVSLKDKPSWKNQSLISALNGLKELQDPRGMDVALSALRDNRSPRWWLATSIWDYPIAAAETIVSLGGVESAYETVRERFLQSMAESDLNDIFANVLLVSILADPRGSEIFDRLKLRFQGDDNALKAVEMMEAQFQTGVENRKKTKK